MRRYRALLCWIPLSIAAIAQTMTPGVSGSSTSSPPKALRPISPAAELALDAAKRWTQEALDDSSNLPPINQDLLLARIAKTWNTADHVKAQEYLKGAIEHLETQTSKSETESEVLSEISSDVMVVDRGMWNRLIKLLHPSDASGAIAAEAQTLVEHEDPEGALKLEKKSLELGGSWADLETLSSLIGKNQTLATELFDEILNSASTHDGNTDLISEILNRLNAQDDAFSRLLDKERRQRLADLVAQRILGGKREEACEYSLELEPLRSQYSPALQGQFRAIVDNCNREDAYGRLGPGAKTLDSTDDLVQAMNEASNVQIKSGLRQRAVNHAAHLDGDYERAIRLCMEASPQERAGAAFPFDRFDNLASNLAWEAVRTAFRNHDDLGLQRILVALPPALRAHVEISAIRYLSGIDKVQSLLMLSDARNLLEHEVPPHTTTYFLMLSETAQLSPQDINVSWRVLGKGLNRFAERMKTQTLQSPGRLSQQTPAYVNPLYPWFLPQEALADESLVRAIVGDLTSPEFRACLRLTVIQAFLTRYFDALKESPTMPVTSASAAKH